MMDCYMNFPATSLSVSKHRSEVLEAKVKFVLEFHIIILTDVLEVHEELYKRVY